MTLIRRDPAHDRADARSPTGLIFLFALGALTVLGWGSVVEHTAFLLDYDTRFWWLGGVSWWQGLSPYDHAHFMRLWLQHFGQPPVIPAGFVYPGTILPLSLTLGLVPWDVARWLMRALNGVAYAGCLVLLWRLFVRGSPGGTDPRSRAFWVALAAVSPAAGMAIYQGQLALLVTLGLLVFWWGLESKQMTWIVLGLLLAMIKPQLTLVPALFLAITLGDRKVWGAALAVCLLTAVVLLWTTPADFLSDLATSIAEHGKQEYNQAYYYDSAMALLSATRIGERATPLGALFGLVAACGLGLAARRSSQDTRLRLFQIAVATTLATMPLHRYDQTLHMLLVGSAWAIGSRRRGYLLLFFCILHEVALRLTWEAKELTGLPMPMAPTSASLLALPPLALLVWWWWQDRHISPA